MTKKLNHSSSEPNPNGKKQRHYIPPNRIHLPKDFRVPEEIPNIKKAIKEIEKFNDNGTFYRLSIADRKTQLHRLEHLQKILKNRLFQARIAFNLILQSETAATLKEKSNPSSDNSNDPKNLDSDN